MSTSIQITAEEAAELQWIAGRREIVAHDELGGIDPYRSSEKLRTCAARVLACAELREAALQGAIPAASVTSLTGYLGEGLDEAREELREDRALKQSRLERGETVGDDVEEDIVSDTRRIEHIGGFLERLEALGGGQFCSMCREHPAAFRDHDMLLCETCARRQGLIEWGGLKASLDLLESVARYARMAGATREEVCAVVDRAPAVIEDVFGGEIIEVDGARMGEDGEWQRGLVKLGVGEVTV